LGPYDDIGIIVVNPMVSEVAAPLMLMFFDVVSDDPIERSVDAPETETVKLSTAPSTQTLDPAATTVAPPRIEIVDAGDANADAHRFPPAEPEDVKVTADPEIRMVDVA
jgi:hypothetical protein